MTAPIRPASSKAFQREKWAWTPTIATSATTLIPTALEANAAGGLDVSCYLFDSTARPQKTTNLVSRERRICDGAQYQQIGITQYEGGEMLAMLDPQAAAASNGKKAWEKFVAGTTGFLIRRLGIDVNTDFATGQFVDVYPTEFGEPYPTTVGDGESAENAFSVTFAITGPIARNVALT